MNDSKFYENKNTHDYRDTIREAAETDDGVAAEERERKIDSEIAYETLAVDCSMGMLGMEDTAANLIQLELAQELMYLQDPQSHKPDDDI